jgi:hypothetical protein
MSLRLRTAVSRVTASPPRISPRMIRSGRWRRLALSNSRIVTAGKLPSAARASEAEAMARDYVNANFKPDDWLAVVAINRKTGETVQRVRSHLADNLIRVLAGFKAANRILPIFLRLAVALMAERTIVILVLGRAPSSLPVVRINPEIFGTTDLSGRCFFAGRHLKIVGILLVIETRQAEDTRRIGSSRIAAFCCFPLEGKAPSFARRAVRREARRDPRPGQALPAARRGQV